FENALALLRLALERGWPLGLLLLAFSVGALLSQHFGFLDIPKAVREWAGVGVLFGLATLVVSAAVKLETAMGRLLTLRRERRRQQQAEEAEEHSVISNLSALHNDEQLAALLRLLTASGPRF